MSKLTNNILQMKFLKNESMFVLAMRINRGQETLLIAKYSLK